MAVTTSSGWRETTGACLAESGLVSVRWPMLVVHTPPRMETYTSHVHMRFQFTKSICFRKTAVTFKTYALLLYHGVPIGETPTYTFHQPYMPIPLPTPPTIRPRLPPWKFRTHRPGGGLAWWKRRRRRRNQEILALRKMKRKARRLERRSKRKRREKVDAFELYWRWKMRLAGIGTSEERRRREAEEGSEGSEGRHQDLILKERGLRETGEGKLEVIPKWRREGEAGETREEGETALRIESENTRLHMRRERVTSKETRDTGDIERLEWRNRRGRERQQHRTHTISNTELDSKPAIGDIVEATSQEPSFAWGGNATIQGVRQLLGLYSNNHTLVFPCDALAPAGFYSVRLVAPELATESARLIVSSMWFQVDWSAEFAIQVNRASIQPCYTHLKVSVSYPYCTAKKEMDKVRVYARLPANVTSANRPVVERYVSEVPVKQNEKHVRFDCNVFEREATEYCFVYVNTARTNVTSIVRRQCVPYYKPNALRQDGQWGTWSAWTPCTTLCDAEGRESRAGQRQRHRFCDSPPPRNGGRYCQGSSLEEESHPPAKHVEAQVKYAWLRPGGQWLKLRDGNSSAAPLLVLLPAAPRRPALARPAPRSPAHASPRVSTGSVLLLEFHSDVNTTMGKPQPRQVGLRADGHSQSVSGDGDKGLGVSGAGREVSGQYLLEGMHVAALVFVALLLVAVVVLAVIHWRHYRLYQRARLVPESPYVTPPGSPSKATTATALASTLTLSEVISLKSLVLRPCLPVSLPLRRRGAPALPSSQDTEPLCSAARHSLPNSPFLTRRAATPSMLRRSSSQMSRLLRRGSGTFRRKRRRFASVDELETRCISPISEMQREDEADSSKEMQGRREDEAEVKYREHRKSVMQREPRLTPKLAKDRLNHERVRRSLLSRSTSAATVRHSSSVSDVSVNGTDTEMEYDYYDYDMDNASAVPGSLFGMDPLLLAWVPPFFTGPDGVTPTHDAIPLEMLSLQQVLPSPPEAPPRPTALPLPNLNIPNTPAPPSDAPMQTSLLSEEANDRVELQQEVQEEEDLSHSSTTPFEDDSTPTATTCSKILNLDDIQFADDSDSAEEL
ncbi:LOW QUALITY PROTEIN: uncharacterized protein LOC135091918 [Scylla paramamosain]|uniref:LOW QUALITY PROTEIN: uncharacterized protein LOC135091918 n=1 Tax=Scylla paramamosain TaxID=85552 RepID=UPI003083CAC7